MSYTLLHTNTKPNRYLEFNGVDVFLSGVEKPEAKTKVTPEQEQSCIDGIAAAKTIGQQGDIACEPGQAQASQYLSNYFNSDGYTPPAAESKNSSGIQATPSIPGAPGTNINAQPKVIIPQTGSREGSNNGLPPISTPGNTPSNTPVTTNNPFGSPNNSPVIPTIPPYPGIYRSNRN